MIFLDSLAAQRWGLPNRSRQMTGCIALYVALAMFPPAFAQRDQGNAPPREGNIYDHKDHQPTADDVCSDGAGRSSCPSYTSRQQVEEEVQKLLRETDMDIQSGRRQLDSPNGALIRPARDR